MWDLFFDVLSVSTVMVIVSIGSITPFSYYFGCIASSFVFVWTTLYVMCCIAMCTYVSFV